MAFDSLQLFTDALAITATGDSSKVTINTTGIDGQLIEVAVTLVSGTDPTLDIVVNESEDDFSSEQQIATMEQIIAAGRFFVKVNSNKEKLRLGFTIGGTNTPTFTLTAGIVSGGQRDTFAAPI